MEKICPICGKKFFKKNKPRQFLCSQECKWRNNRKNDLRGTHFYRIWERMDRVCYSKADFRYPLYGGRGIEILWDNFYQFRDDMYPSYLEHLGEHGKLNTTIDRIDSNGHYCKENCRWATRKEQAINRRSTIHLTHNGETKTLEDWAKSIGIRRHALWLRLYRYKWPIERALKPTQNVIPGVSLFQN